jgi:drug/metabolite transporter (DMT)-like permease
VTIVTLTLILFSEACGILGQILFKHAMGTKWLHSRGAAWQALFAGIAAMAVGFFVWLELLRRFDLSFLYPFEGLNRLVMLFAAIIFLKERVAPRLWVGVLLISAGVAVVAGS